MFEREYLFVFVQKGCRDRDYAESNRSGGSHLSRTRIRVSFRFNGANLEIYLSKQLTFFVAFLM